LLPFEATCIKQDPQFANNTSFDLSSFYNQEELNNLPPLYTAVVFGKFHSTRLLLQHKADPCIQDILGWWNVVSSSVEIVIFGIGLLYR
jgi:hypothetical protein